MPRKKENHVRDKGGRPPRPPKRIDTRGMGSPDGGMTKEKPVNGFQRNITGLNTYFFELLEEYGLLQGDKRVVPVLFSGITEAPGRQIEYRKPVIVVAKSGMVALSGMVDGKNLDEIGHGSGPITQVGAPELDGYDTPRRLNVALGEKTKGFSEQELTSALPDGPLALSEVAAVNGQTVGYRGAADMWRRPPQHRSIHDFGPYDW